MEIRNEIEHEDRKPPKLERCLEMLDVVWYFLKSTDVYVRSKTDLLTFDHTPNTDFEQYWVQISIDIKRTWKMTASGWLPPEFILRTYVSDCLEVLTEPLHTGEFWKIQGQFLEKKDTDLFFFQVQ